VTPEATRQEILRIVREELLFGSERSIPLDAPLGDLGVGLDSLALVRLLTAVEATFGIDVPDDVWTARGPLSVDDLAEIVGGAPKREAALPPPAAEGPVLRGRMERVEHALAGGGPARRAAWGAVRLLAPVKHFAFAHSRNLVLERRLDDDAGLPQIEPPPEVVVRPYAAGDEGGLAGLWPSFTQRHGRSYLRRSLRKGVIVLVAAEEKRIVALDLLSPAGEEEVEIASGDACYGYWLAEAPAARGRGIGLSLLAYSLRFARERGFRTQLTYVADTDTLMLAAATQLLGFRSIGTARRLRVLGLTGWSWDVDGRRRRGRRLVL
jgi:acyl carrier protein/GNAT superfamily N-acetyltransferase